MQQAAQCPEGLSGYHERRARNTTGVERVTGTFNLPHQHEAKLAHTCALTYSASRHLSDLFSEWSPLQGVLCTRMKVGRGLLACLPLPIRPRQAPEYASFVCCIVLLCHMDALSEAMPHPSTDASYRLSDSTLLLRLS